MPNRVIREGLLTSPDMAKLSEAAKVFFFNLMLVADDYGCFHGHPTLVRAACYPMDIDAKTDKQIMAYIAECQTAGVLSVYTSDNKPYLSIHKFGQRIRIMRRKFPDPSTCQTSCPTERPSECQRESESESESEIDPPLSPLGRGRDKKSRVSASRPESFEEVEQVVVGKLGLTENDAMALWEHWQGNGFRNNGRVMASWKHTASKWERCKMFYPSLQVNGKTHR